MKVTFTDVDQQSVNGRTARAVNRTTGEVHTVTIAGGEADFGQLTYQQAYEVYGVTASGARVTSVLVKTETNEPGTPSEPPQSAPSLSATAVSDTHINLTIGSVSGATGYEYRVDGGTPVDVGTNRTPQVTGLTAETQYSFEARAYNAEGAGPWSSVVQATTQAAESTPTPLLDLATSLGAVAIWRGAEGSGSTLVDALGNHNGTYHGGVTFGAPLSADAGAGSVIFDGVDDYASVPHHSSLNPTAAMTVWGVFDMDSIDLGLFRFISKRAIGAGSGFTMSLRPLDNARIGVHFHGGSPANAYSPDNSLPLTGIHLIGVTIKPGAIEFYVDGVLVHSDPSIVSVSTNTEPLFVGGRLNGSDDATYHSGRRGECAMHQSALTAQQHLDLFNASGLGA